MKAGRPQPRPSVPVCRRAVQPPVALTPGPKKHPQPSDADTKRPFARHLGLCPLAWAVALREPCCIFPRCALWTGGPTVSARKDSARACLCRKPVQPPPVPAMSPGWPVRRATPVSLSPPSSPAPAPSWLWPGSPSGLSSRTRTQPLSCAPLWPEGHSAQLRPSSRAQACVGKGQRLGGLTCVPWTGKGLGLQRTGRLPQEGQAPTSASLGRRGRGLQPPQAHVARDLGSCCAGFR